MSFFKVRIFKRGYYLVLYNDGGKPSKKRYISFKDKGFVLPVLTKEYFDFVGWQYKDISDAKTAFKTVNGINPLRRKKVELYPLFVRKEAYIIYHNGDSPVRMNEDIIDCGEKVRLSKNRLQKSGHYFLGWATSPGSRDVTYKDGVEVFVSEDMELYPIWYAYQIVYNANVERKTKLQTVYVAKGQVVQLELNPYKQEGYTFLGWDTKSDAKYPQYRAGQKVVDLTKDKKITLYAIWKVTLNRVVFDANGGYGSMKPIATAEEKVKLPKTVFYKNGFHFNGWLVKQNAKKPKYDEQSTVTFDKKGQEITLYAMWTLVFGEDYFGLTNKMTKEEKLRILTKEYARYNQLIISNNPERKQEAKAVIESISALRIMIKGT